MIRLLSARNIPSVAACVVILLAAAGCGQPTMAKVSGTITWREKPVPDAIVQFVHKNRPGASGRTDAAGRFSLTTLKPGDGAFLGPVRVTVQPFLPGIDPDKPTPPPPPRPDIPDRYRTVDKTPLTAEVVAGKKNVIDFKLD